MGEKLQTTSPRKVHNRFAPKIHAYSKEGSLLKMYKELRIVKFQILNFWQFGIFLFFFGTFNMVVNGEL